MYERNIWKGEGIVWLNKVSKSTAWRGRVVYGKLRQEKAREGRVM